MILELLQIPELASEHGATVDAMNEFVHWFMGVLFVGWSLFLIYVFTRYRRKRNPSADYTGVRSHASTHVEVGVVIVEAILLLGFAFPFWTQRSSEFPTGPEVVRVRAVGYQFGWAFHYPGPDGVFGAISPDNYYTDAAGLDRSDPNGKDDIVSLGTLTLPKNRPIVIMVTSKDVIHNLALVQMRSAQDAIPGTEYPMWFTPTKTGEWEIICGQLCGAGHASMKAMMSVVSEAEFDQWVLDTAPKVEEEAPVETASGENEESGDEAGLEVASSIE